MSTTHLYNNWYKQFEQLQPGERVTRLKIFTWLLIGILKSKSVHLYYIALQIPGNAKVLSTVKRLTRFLNNPAIKVRKWYKKIACDLLEVMIASIGEVRLIVDGSKVGFHHQLLIVSLAFKRRSLPLVWTWVKYRRGHSSSGRQLALLEYVHGLIPEHVPVTLVGDSEFGAIAVLKQLELWSWNYVLRQKGSHKISSLGLEWKECSSLVTAAGQRKWLPHVLLTEQHAFMVNLLIVWEKGEKEPWILATNYETQKEAYCAYKRRMWIEQMFSDMKGKGFDLEATHLQHIMRLSRLTLIVALLYVWLFSIGTYAVKKGDRHIVDRNDRRDLSIFQIGLRMIERFLTNNIPCLVRLIPVPT